MRAFPIQVWFIIAALVLATGIGSAWAQEKDEGKTKKTVAMSQDVFEGLQEAQELIETKQYSNGHQSLKKLLGKPKLSPYEKVQIWNLTAYAYYLQERYQDAIKAYEKVPAQTEVPEAIVQSTLKTLWLRLVVR